MDDAAAKEIEPHGDMPQVRQRALYGVVAFDRCEKHKKTARSGSKKLAALGSRCDRFRVPIVDLAVAYIAREALLQYPVFMQDIAKGIDLSGVQFVAQK